MEKNFNSNSFVCPFCNVYAQQHWHNTISSVNQIYPKTLDSMGQTRSPFEIKNSLPGLSICQCENCKNYSVWINEKMVYPLSNNIPMPDEDMPEDVKYDYMEAKTIIYLSPRGSCALLRLALDKLLSDLLIEGNSLKTKIDNYVKKEGVDEKLSKALHSVRIVGNESVHIATLNMDDNVEIATLLFSILNIIVRKTITEKKEIDNLFDSLPENKTKSI